MTLLLGVDEGTSAVKAMLYDGDLRPLAEARREKGLAYPRPGWVEQDPDEILDAVIDAVASVIDQTPGPIDACGLDHQGESVLAWDRDSGRPLTPGPLGCPRPVHHASRDRVALVALERHRVAVLEVDQQPAVEHEEELVLVVVLVPVEVAFDDAEPDDGVVDRRQRLVEPGVVAGDLRRDVDQREAPVLVLELDVIAVVGAHV
jgi:hypothetical protein